MSIEELHHAVKQFKERLGNMAISRQQFDQDLATLITAGGNLIAAVQALPHPGDADFTAEDQAVLTAAAALQTEIQNITPTPPPPPGP